MTDGEVLVASFESRGIYAFDLNDKQLWEKDLGRKQMRSQFGEGSTPALHGRYLVHVWDHQGESFIVALDKPLQAVVLFARLGVEHREDAVVRLEHVQHGFDSSAALAGGEFYLRGYRYLYCIAES